MSASDVRPDRSKSRLSRRLRPSQASVRSTTQRLAWTTKPRCPGGVRTTSTVTRCSSAAHSAQSPWYAPSTQTCVSVGATALAAGSSAYAPSTLGASAGVTTTASGFPSVSTARWRLRPFTFFPVAAIGATGPVWA